MPLALLNGSAQACFCASWVLPPQLTKLTLSAAIVAWLVFPVGFLEGQPMTRGDLEEEQLALRAVGHGQRPRIR